MAKLKLGVIVGSNRRDSINRKLAEALVKLGGGAVDANFIQIDDLPMYNQDNEQPLPSSVARFKGEVEGSDALLFVTPLLQRFLPGLSGFNALSPGIVMGIMILPLVSSLSEDAMRGVPRGLREGSYALGATKMQTSLRVVVPAAFSGITAAFILAVSRAIGETMIVAIAAGQQPRFSANPLQPVETMTAYIVQVSLGDTPTGTIEYQTIFAVGFSLFLMTLALNIAAQRLRKRVLKGAA